MNSIYNGDIAYDRARTYPALETTGFRICAKVKNRELGTCTKVKGYL
jgi:hypothetical protein